MPQSTFLWRWRTIGDHVHVDVFSGQEGQRAKCGVLSFRQEEWADLMSMLTPHGNRNAITYAGSRPEAIVEEAHADSTGDTVADKGASGSLWVDVLCTVCGAFVEPLDRCVVCGARL